MADFWLLGAPHQVQPGTLSGPLSGRSFPGLGQTPMPQMQGPCQHSQALHQHMQNLLNMQDLQPQHVQQVVQQQIQVQVQRLEQMAHQFQVSGLSQSSSFRPEQSAPERSDQQPHAALPFESRSTQPNSATVVDVLTLATVRAFFPMSVAENLSADAAARAFQRFGEVVGLDMQSCKSKGEVIVTFSEPKAAQQLLMALTPERVLDFTNEFAPPAVERTNEILESAKSSTNEQSSTSPSVEDIGVLRTNLAASTPSAGEVPVPDYATLLAPTPGRLPTPFRSPAKEVLESAHQFSPERVAQGLDLRTSIILGGLPKTCSSERFLHTMKGCQLITKLRFFYLPVDKPRGRAVGYIFMDFQQATDLLEFWTRLQELCEGIGGPKALQNLYVSYSLIQGRDQLLEHFGGSDIMFEPDANKRPQFFFPED